MKYYLSEKCVLKLLEKKSVYNISEDELYELDADAFGFLERCTGPDGCRGDGSDSEFIDYCLSEGILTTHNVAAKRPPVINSPVPSLRYLELQITDRCNLKCRHCYIGKPANKELPLNEIKTILDEFEKMQGLRLLITGGEPLAHSCFDEVNSLLPSYSFRKVLFTNGLMLSKKILNRLNVDEIQFSIDGMEHGHDALRGKGIYKKIMLNVHDALLSKIDVSAATMIHKDNLCEFDDMALHFKNIGLKDWIVDVPCFAGNIKENSSLIVSPETAGQYLNYGFGGGLHGGGEGFACGLHLMSVLANGTVCKCAFYSQMPVGSVKDGLAKCWKKIRPLRLVDLECFSLSCPMISECRGGCRYRAEVISGERRKDIYKCYSYDIIKSDPHEAGQ